MKQENTNVKEQLSRFDVSFFVILFALFAMLVAGFIVK